jgi:hypothetical protein
LTKKYDKLWVFGDSYSTPNLCVDPKDSFWGLTASHCNIPTIINCSRAGNSWTSVQHLLVSLGKQIDWQNDLIFVGIPLLERITVFDNYRDTKYVGHKICADDWSIEQFDIDEHRGLVSLQNYASDRQLVLHHNRPWLETDVLRQIFLLSQWLERESANYLIINLSRDLDQTMTTACSDFVLSRCKNLKNAILFKDTYYSINLGVNEPADCQGEPQGHHGPAGNRHFFINSVLPKLKECGLC